MKYRTILWLVGGTIIVGTAAYCVYKCLQHQQNDTAEPDEHSYADSYGVITPKVVSDNDFQEESFAADPVQTQQDAVASIMNRHQAAAQELRSILSDMEKSSIEHAKKIDQINYDLDQLLE